MMFVVIPRRMMSTLQWSRPETNVSSQPTCRLGMALLRVISAFIFSIISCSPIFHVLLFSFCLVFFFDFTRKMCPPLSVLYCDVVSSGPLSCVHFCICYICVFLGSWWERCLRLSWPSTGPQIIKVTAQSVTSRLRPSTKDTLDFIFSFFFISSCFSFFLFFFNVFLFFFPFFSCSSRR